MENIWHSPAGETELKKQKNMQTKMKNEEEEEENEAHTNRSRDKCQWYGLFGQFLYSGVVVEKCLFLCEMFDFDKLFTQENIYWTSTHNEKYLIKMIVVYNCLSKYWKNVRVVSSRVHLILWPISVSVEPILLCNAHVCTERNFFLAF